MSTLETVLIVALALLAAAITVVVILQQGRGADIGAAFGAGGANTIFGSTGLASPLATLTWSLAGVFLFCGLFIPAAYRRIDHFFFAVLPKWVASGLNWLLLVPFFFLVFVPARLIQVLTGNDPMARRVPTDLPTYWIPRKPVASLDQYKKQH